MDLEGTSLLFIVKVCLISRRCLVFNKLLVGNALCLPPIQAPVLQMVLS
jgi:hypothetical protein